MLGGLRSPLLGLQPVHHIYYINSDARPLMEIKKASMEKWVISPSTNTVCILVPARTRLQFKRKYVRQPSTSKGR
jgi:hypothetical protein